MKPVYQNTLDVLAFKRPHSIPFIIWGPAPFVAYAAGVEQKSFYLDPELKLRTQLRVVDMFPDALLMPGPWPDFGAALEPTLLGCRPIWHDNQPPNTTHIVDEYEDINKIKFRPVDSLLPEMLRQYEYMWKHIPNHYLEDYGFLDGMGYALGPLETAAATMDFTSFLMGFYDEPELIHKLLDITTEAILYSLREQEKVNGKIKQLYLPDHMSHQVSREMFEEFCYPYYNRIFREFSGATLRMYHNEGNVLHIIDRVADVGANLFHYGSDTARLAEAVGDRVILMGNLHPIDDMLQKTPEEIRAMARRILDEGARDGCMLLSTAGGMAPGTPLENVHAAIEAGLAYLNG